MPHSVSTQPSTETFDLDQPDRPWTADPEPAMKRHSRTPSGNYGVALPFEPSKDERKGLPSQQSLQTEQERSEVKRLRRRSAPGTAVDYNAAVAREGNMVDAMPPPVAAGLSNDISKRRSQYYEEQSPVAVMPIKQRIQRQAPVIAELRTNVIIKDEFTLVTDLSYQLAQRYTRPDSCIMIKVDHSACLALGGTFDPCYILTLNAVPAQMGPTANKRNAALIQTFMADILSVPSERGVVKFVPILEENLAIGGNTLQGEMDKAEKPESTALKKSINDAAKKSSNLKKTQTKSDAETNGNAFLTSTASSKTGKHDSASSAELERPKTAHGTSAAVNGLRMNPITPDELGVVNKSRTPTGRPKSMSATPERASILKPFNPEPIPNVAKQASQKAHAQARASKPDAQKARNVPIGTKNKTTNSTPLAPRPVQVPPTSYNEYAITPFSKSATTSTKVAGPPAAAIDEEKRTKSVYLDMVSALPPKGDTTVKSEEVDGPTRGRTMDSSTAAAAPNSSKRRSATFTATPKIPPMPPSPLEKEETKSISSRLSKRKSFMKMFKRDSVQPWYKS